ncbi:hypothetical protein [Oceanobacillus sojae]|uniref:hypothetical protein n=1 Tax=Oceanobacillus sojae TaxID=582851 RepID=UPI0021A2F04C|nr:hypothetical protein [Oceanobacillus sojae]MCT1904082.1 hypothetical protein [Oceanobacillus sojae]
MSDNKITDHYLVEDIDQVFEAIERFSSAAMKGFKLAENAQFEMKNALINEMEVAYAKLEMLHEKKKLIDDRNKAEQTRRHMF